MAKFITADWHLGEDRFEIMGRPFSTAEEMVTKLIQNHNSLVKPEDTVYVVGDVCYQKHPEFLDNVKWFNGNKILIRGNHDKVISDKEFSNYFHTIIAEGEGLDLDVEGIACYLTHYPTRGIQGRFNLVGHIHGAWKYQLNMLNIGVDAHHFYPVNLNRVPFHFKAVDEYYDDDVWIAYKAINNVYQGIRGKAGSYFNG